MAAGNASAGRDPGLALSAWLDNNIGTGIFGGELRYDHEMGDLKLSSGGHQHPVHQPEATRSITDFVFASPRRKRPCGLRAGRRRQVIVFGNRSRAGLPAAFEHRGVQRRRDLRPMVSVGAGIKFNIAKSTMLRLEVQRLT